MLYDIFFLDAATRMYYYIFVFLLLMILLLKNRKLITSEYRKINRKTWLMLFIITILGFIVRFAFLEMQTTEIFMGTSRNIAVSISEEHMMPQDTHTRGYSLLIAPLYSLTGNIMWSAHIFDIVIGSLSIIMIFLLTYLLFKDQKAAIISAIILSALPWHIFFSGTQGEELTASFFVMLSIILILISIKSKEPEIYFLTFISLLFCALIRKEEMILLLVLIIYFLIKKNPIRIRKKINIIVYLLMAVILVIPFLIDALYGKIDEGDIGSVYMSQNIISVLEMFEYNFYIILFIVAPVVLYLVNKRNIIKKTEQILFLLLWYSINIIPFMIHNDIDNRYFIFFLVPFIILGSSSISGLLKTKYEEKVILILIATLLLSAIHVYSDCTQDSNCEYIYAQPSDEIVTKFAQIQTILNNTDKKSMLVLFVDGDTKEAYITYSGKYNRYIVLNVDEACYFYNSVISNESRVENIVNVETNRADGTNKTTDFNLSSCTGWTAR